MPHSCSSVRSLSRELCEEFGVGPDEDVTGAMRRIDDAASRVVREHLLGPALPPARRRRALDGAA